MSEKGVLKFEATVWLVGNPDVMAYAKPIAAPAGERRQIDGHNVVEIIGMNSKRRWLLIDPPLGTTSDMAPDVDPFSYPEDVDTGLIAFTTVGNAEREIAIRSLDASIVDANCTLERLATARSAILASASADSIAALPVASA